MILIFFCFFHFLRCENFEILFDVCVVNLTTCRCTYENIAYAVTST